MVSETLIRTILSQYALPPGGNHGIAHWARVYENAVRLATGARVSTGILGLFAVLHDACRLAEGTDPDHGRRAAEYAAGLRGTHFDLPDRDFALLHTACAHHADGLIDGSDVVLLCWDADRLDLGRVDVTPDPALLCTAAGRNVETREWADERARSGDVPADVLARWGIGPDELLSR